MRYEDALSVAEAIRRHPHWTLLGVWRSREGGFVPDDDAHWQVTALFQAATVRWEEVFIFASRAHWQETAERVQQKVTLRQRVQRSRGPYLPGPVLAEGGAQRTADEDEGEDA